MNNNEEKRSTGAHNLILEERGSLTVTGVSDIDSFDEETVVVYTDLGELTVREAGFTSTRLTWMPENWSWKGRSIRSAILTSRFPAVDFLRGCFDR